MDPEITPHAVSTHAQLVNTWCHEDGIVSLFLVWFRWKQIKKKIWWIEKNLCLDM